MYCRHCGKEISESDKFCKYCGGSLDNENKDKNLEESEGESSIQNLAQEAESAPKKGFFSKFRKGAKDENGKYVSKTVLEDRVYEERTIVNEKHIELSENYPLEKIVLVKHGIKNKLQIKGLLCAILCLLLAVSLGAVALISRKFIPNESVAYLVLFGSIIAMFCAFAWFIEIFYNLRGLNELKENQIIVKKYGLKKPAELMRNGEVYQVALTTDCAVCHSADDSEIIGDLHIEKIANRLVAVCNLNRRHIWHIDEKAIFDALENNSIKILNKGEKISIQEWIINKDLSTNDSCDEGTNSAESN